MELLDCIIVGGGPAGLNAAVVLGRSRRKVLVFDTGKQRNRYSHGIHNYLTRDHILPKDFIGLCHKELRKYGVKFSRRKVVNARKNEEGFFAVKDEKGDQYYSRRLLIATGLADNLPEVPGIKEMYGISVFHCPYCDGWEVRNKRLGVYARNKEGAELALSLKGWSEHVTLFTDGKNKVKSQQEHELKAHGIEIIREPIQGLVGTNGLLKKIAFKNGSQVKCDALFFVNGFTQQCHIAELFGVEMSEKGVVITNRKQQTNTPGLFVAGDASKDMHFVVVAAAEGAKAGVTINKELLKEDRH